MGIKSLSNSSGIVNFQKHQSMLAGIELNKFHHLETVRLGSSVASVEFTNLGQYSDYQHLQLRMTAKVSSSLVNLDMTFNGDTAANYSWHELYGDGSTVVSGAGANQTFMKTLISDAATADVFGAGVVDILDPFETTKYTTMRSFSGDVSGGKYVILRSGSWRNTNAISSMTMQFTAGNIAIGSRFSLYGLKVRA